MSGFIRKTISHGQTIGDKLRRSRLEKNLNLDLLAKQTKIQIKYLEDLENGNYTNLPGDVYIRTWIKLYAETLGLSPQELLVDYKVEKQLTGKTKTQETTKKFSWQKLLKPKVIKWGVVFLVVAIFLGYLAWEINSIISPPTVNIFQPSNNLRTTDSSVVVSGQTQPEVQLKINNEVILLDDEGKFSQTINLTTGLNNLEISAKKKHSKTNNIQLVILRETTE